MPTQAEVLEFQRADNWAVYDGLKAGKRYSFMFRAFNGVGPSSWSPWSDPVSTLTSLPSVPDRPSVLESTIVAVSLRCVKPENSGKIVSKLVVQRRELRPGGVKSEWANEMGFPPAPGPAGTVCDLELKPLKPNVVYQFRCAAVNVHGQSDWSLPSFRTRTKCAEAPTAPLTPEMAKAYPTGVDLVWVASDPKGSPIVGHSLELKRLRRSQDAPLDPHALSESDANESSDSGSDDESLDSDDARRPTGPREVTSATADKADGIVTTLEIGYRNKYHAENLEPSAKYVFRVAAANGEGQGDWSPWSDVFQCKQPEPRPQPAHQRGRRTQLRGAALFPGAGAAKDLLT